MKAITIASLLISCLFAILCLTRESEGSAIGDFILALPEDEATQRLDLFPTVRTLVRVMRMINRPAAMDRVKDSIRRNSRRLLTGQY